MPPHAPRTLRWLQAMTPIDLEGEASPALPPWARWSLSHGSVQHFGLVALPASAGKLPAAAFAVTRPANNGMSERRGLVLLSYTDEGRPWVRVYDRSSRPSDLGLEPWPRSD